MSLFSSSPTWQNSGSISALNGTVTLNAPGSASAVIGVSGTFIGKLKVVGSGDTIESNGVQGGRLLFRSGVGSTGSNETIRDNNSPDTEFRIVTGGRSITVEMIEYTSGTAEVKITASATSSTVFINGPVHSSMEEAVRNGRAFSVGTGSQSVGSGNIIKSTFFNPPTSGVNAFVTLRQFTNNSTSTPQQVNFYVSPTELASGDVTPNNLKTGGVTSAIRFRTLTNATSLGTPTLSQVLPINGIEKSIEVLRMVQPGEIFGYQLSGVGNGSLLNTLQMSMTFIWYEEAAN
ncbi:hypothetical protein [Nonlabens sp. YIK11]|uniref:hypothetical protein n=1 Tax=Nonlabens sp. YIK11 TaxID=1453349 RepID=UPI000A8F3031|nr:hypothetical protein [Nonlabens sp. YIK11]